MHGNFRPATLEEYIKWLNGYMARGGRPTHYRENTSFQAGDFLYVTGIFFLRGEGGAMSRNIIVDKGATLKLIDPRRDFGHNCLFYMKGYKYQEHEGSQTRCVPIFSDGAFLSIWGMKRHIRRLKEQRIIKEKARAKELQEHRRAMEDRKSGPLSSSEDNWSGNPAIDRQHIVGRALQSRHRP